MTRIEKGKGVFVVHGRNLAAKEAMFQFLRAIELQPLDWEDAGDLVGHATPNTLESVRTAMARSQAVIVLLTGDDMARLRPEFADEDYSFQPRPNVLLEAGLALAMLGTERTLLVRTSAVRGVTDLDGLNYLDVDNTASSRQNLAGRLARAGCDARIDRGGHLSPTTGGDFEAAFAIDDPLGPNILRRGGYDDHVVDSTISYTISNIKLLAELESELLTQGSSDMKYSYLGVSGASNWLRLTQEPAYAANSPRQLVSRALPELFGHEALAGREIDLISLGPGEGAFDSTMIAKVAENCTIRNYYPIDLSIELLQQTVDRTLPVCRRNGIPIKAILGDFLELRKYRPVYGYDDVVNVATLVGYTFGNYNESSLLGTIREALNPGDFLLLDARLHGLTEEISPRQLRNRSEEILRPFSHLANNRFAFGPVELAAKVEAQNAIIKQDLSEVHTSVPRAFNVVTYCENLNARLRRNNRAVSHRRLDLAITTLYDPDSLIDFIERRGFNRLASRSDGKSLVLLLQRTRN